MVGSGGGVTCFGRQRLLPTLTNKMQSSNSTTLAVAAFRILPRRESRIAFAIATEERQRESQNSDVKGYFDYNATTPLSAVAREAWTSVAEQLWHNPSSLYREAGVAKRRLDEEREAAGEWLGCPPERIVFTSGATESNNAVVEYAARHAGEGRTAALVSAVEHPSVREAARKWFGPRTLDWSLGKGFQPDLQTLREVISESAVGLVSMMAANNETGVVHPWNEVAAICREAGVLFHCDAAQWAGKRSSSGLAACDFITVSGHKFGGPKGVGMVVVPEGMNQFEGQVGGPQESGRRGGTEDVPGIAAMMAALRERAPWDETMVPDRDWFEDKCMRTVPGCSVVGKGVERLGNTSMLLLPRFNNLKWLTRLSRLGFAVSTGSACSSGKGNPSHVMEAMGLDYDEMGRVVRISAGPETCRPDWQALAEALETVWNELQSGGAKGKIDLGRL